MSVKYCVNELLRRAVITGAEQVMNEKRCSRCGQWFPEVIFRRNVLKLRVCICPDS